MELVNLSTTAAPLPRRLATVKALDLATDGGPVLGSSILLAGAPGAGKSTLLLQTAAEAADAIYVTGEETTGMLALRALRLALAHGSGILAAACTDAEEIAETITTRHPSLMVIDSIQKIRSSRSRGMPGLTTQMNACTSLLIDAARLADTAIVLVCHETKAGGFAGPRTIEHLVDVALRMTREPERSLVVVKNRFGRAGRQIPLLMTSHGLIIDEEKYRYDHGSAIPFPKSYTDIISAKYGLQ